MPTKKRRPSAKPDEATPREPIYDNRDLKPLERLLLLAVVDHADADTWFRGCLDELAAWTGLDQSTVEHHRLDLIGRGLLAYSDQPEEAAQRDCTSHWCSPETRTEHPQRVRLVEPTK